MRSTGNSLMKVVRQHGCPWSTAYIERWLRAPVRMPNGTWLRERGTRQGAVVSPLLADSLSSLCVRLLDATRASGRPVRTLRGRRGSATARAKLGRGAHQALDKRFAECRLQLHTQKTKIVYCKDANRTGEYPERSFDFLGYALRPPEAIGRHRKRFVSFIRRSAVGRQRMRLEVRRWRMHLRSDLELEEIAKWARPTLTGWVRYYGRFYPSKLREELRTIDAFSRAMGVSEMKRFRGHTLAAWEWLRSLRRRNPTLFAHWALGPAAG